MNREIHQWIFYKQFINGYKNAKWSSGKSSIVSVDKNGKIIEKRSYWNFSTLERLFEQKLKNKR